MTILKKKNYRSVAVIIPTYNELANIADLITAIRNILPSSRICIVDDNSPDGTAGIINNMKDIHLTLIKRKEKGGRGSAVLAGMQELFADKAIEKFVEMDADFSHDPAELTQLVNAANSHTVSIGSRYVNGSRIENWPFLRYILSKGANTLIRYILSLSLHDATNGYRCYSRQAVSFIVTTSLVSSGFTSLAEISYILQKKGFRFVEAPSHFVNRRQGNSNATVGEFLRSLASLFQIRMRAL